MSSSAGFLIAELTGRLKQPKMISGAAGTGCKVDGDARIRSDGILASKLQFDVGMHHGHAGVAPHIARSRTQKLVNVSSGALHDSSKHLTA